jgi:hypothetical protein
MNYRLLSFSNMKLIDINCKDEVCRLNWQIEKI